MPEPLLAAVALAAIVTLAWRAGSLAGSGAMAAALVGLAVLAGTGWPGGLVLVVFFVTSSTLSRLTMPRAVAEGDAKGDRRTGRHAAGFGHRRALAGTVPVPGLSRGE